MKIFDVGQEAHGFIAIGQVATGFFALGQGATGVIAIGQLARGVIAIGQVAIGVVTVCQVGFGLVSCVAMLGIAGRWAKGLVLPLFPPAEPGEGEAQLPATTPLDAIRSGQIADGWIDVELSPLGKAVAVTHDGQPVEVELGPSVEQAARARAGEEWNRALLRLRREERLEQGAQRGYREPAPSEVVLVADRMQAVPEPKWRSSGYWLKLAARALVLAVLLGVYTFVAADAILEGLFTIPQ